MAEIKITKELLNNYRKYKREIQLLKEELAQMQHTEAGLSNSVIMDYRDGFPRPQSVIGFNWPLYERRKKRLETRKAQAEMVENWIEEIPDAETRAVFRARYIKRESWVRTAEAAGYAGKEDYVRIRIHDKYLQETGLKQNHKK